jgi:hypothetical protein
MSFENEMGIENFDSYDTSIQKANLYIEEFYEIIKIIEEILKWKLIHNSTTLLLFYDDEYCDDDISLMSWMFDFKDMIINDDYHYDYLYNCEDFIEKINSKIYIYLENIYIKYEKWYYDIIKSYLCNIGYNDFKKNLINCDVVSNINNINGLFRYYVLCMKQDTVFFDFCQFEYIVYLAILVNTKKWINVSISKYILYCLYFDYQHLIDILEPIIYNNYNMVIHMLYNRIVKQ